jgi:hypothetical protein
VCVYYPSSLYPYFVRIIVRAFYTGTNVGDGDGNLQRRDALPERITVSCRSIVCDAHTLGAGVERDSYVVYHVREIAHDGC